MVKISFKGKALTQYRGHDPELKKDILLLPGDQATVSDAKADQLKKDYPEDFIFEKIAASKETEKKPEPKTPVEPKPATPSEPKPAAPAKGKGKGGK